MPDAGDSDSGGLLNALGGLANWWGAPTPRPSLNALLADPQVQKAVGLATGMGPGEGLAVGGIIRGFHGTPHTFEPVEGNPFGEFRSEAIGSGEGAQAYGWGHYVAGNPEVARGYQAKLSGGFTGPNFAAEFKKSGFYADLQREWKSATGNELSDSEINDLASDAPVNDWEPESPLSEGTWKRLQQEAWDATSGASNKALGNLLHVAIKPDESELLDWDGPASNDQMLKLESLLGEDTKPSDVARVLGFSQPATTYKGWGDIDGSDIYQFLEKQLGSDRAASEALHAAGIPGVKYLDAGSRGRPPVDDIRATELAPDQFDLRGYAKGGGAKGYEQTVSEAEMRKVLGDETADDLLSQIRGKTYEKFYGEGKMNYGGRGQTILDEPLDLRSHNYVIFDPSNLRITGRNGEILEPIHHDPFAQRVEPVDHDPFEASGP